MNRIAEALLSLLYPENVACIACGEEASVNADGLCASCAAGLLRCEAPHAVRFTDGFTAGLIYTEEAARAIQRFKYGDARYLAGFLASFLDIPEAWDIEAIVPVPLHKRRLNRRGYNQSALLAEALAARISVPVRPELLVRVRNTKTQTRLNMKQRARNLRGAFRALPEAKGMRLLLIDDVRTTGATLAECAQALRAAGASAVYACAACERERPR